MSHSLKIQRVVHAPIERVFRAWTDREELLKWHCPEGLVVGDASCDPSPGGAYQIQMETKDGDIHLVAGNYVEVDPPHKVSFKWTWQQGGGGAVDSLVTVS